MSISPAFLDELRNRLSLYEVVGRRVQWDRKKSNPRRRDWWACCPFHHEKTPSFHVDEDKGRYHCFGCHQSGDAISFVMETQNLPFPEAVEMLAQEAGMEMPRQSPRDQQMAETRRNLYDVMTEAASYYVDQLKGPDGANAWSYLAEQRNLSEATITEFGLGYAPAARTALYGHLKSKQIEESQMIEAGLVIQPDDGGAHYDRFRDRIMFPIEDSRGRVIAFGARDLSGRARAKYLNSPDTPLFHKGQILYNLRRAREAASDAGTVIVTEGYMDVIALAQAGFPYVTAPLGTALTEDQIRLLWRMAAEPVLCFDGDEAGQRAAFRSLDLGLPLLEPGKSFKFSLLPSGQDPDDLVREHGASAFRQLIEAAQPLSGVLWQREVEAGPLDTPEQRAGFTGRLRGLVAEIRNPDVRRYYGDEISRRINEQFSRPPPDTAGGPAKWPTRRQSEGRSASGSPRRPSVASSSLKRTSLASSGIDKRKDHEALLLAPVIRNPGLLAELEEELSNIEFESPENARLRDSLLELQMLNTQIENADDSPSSLDEAGVLRHLEAKRMRETALRILACGSSLGAQFAGEGDSAEQALERWRHTAVRFRQISMLNADLKKAEATLAADMSEDNFNRLRALKAQIRSLDREDAT